MLIGRQSGASLLSTQHPKTSAGYYSEQDPFILHFELEWHSTSSSNGEVMAVVGWLAGAHWERSGQGKVGPTGIISFYNSAYTRWMIFLYIYSSTHTQTIMVVGYEKPLKFWARRSRFCQQPSEKHATPLLLAADWARAVMGIPAHCAHNRKMGKMKVTPTCFDNAQMNWGNKNDWNILLPGGSVRHTCPAVSNQSCLHKKEHCTGAIIFYLYKQREMIIFFLC